MTGFRLGWPRTTQLSLLAAVTTWTALWAWAGFVESPSGFLIPLLAICLLIATSGMLLRSVGVPALLVAAGQVTLVGLWMNHTWAGDLSRGGWVPTVESMAEVGFRISAAVEVSRSYAAPVPDAAPDIYALLIVAGAGAAVVVDVFACGLRRVPLAGLPLLAVYTAPVSILGGGISWWGFVACALSFLFLLTAEETERLSLWGAGLSDNGRVRDSLDTPVSTTSVRASARKIGFTATGLAVLTPLLLPTLGTTYFDGRGGGSGGEGEGVSITNPMVDLQRDLFRGADEDLITITTTDPDPAYLRISVLDSFDGVSWKPSVRQIPAEQRAEGRMPRPPGLDPDVPREEFTYDVAIGPDFESRWLPTPYPISTISASSSGDWRYDMDTLDFISAVDDQTTEGARYSVEAMRLQPSAQDLATALPAPADIYRGSTDLPISTPDSVRRLAQQVTEDQPSRFEQAVALQEWFRVDGGFTYSLDRAPGSGMDALAEFVEKGPNGRKGYCEQFAAAMALMGRAVGIPSRVAVGFLRPDSVADDTYVYSTHDLHAWPEMYFQGTGWIRFEPTPRDRATDVPGYTSQRVAAPAPSAAPTTRAPDAQQNRIDREPVAPATQTATGGGMSRGGSWVWAALAVLLGVLLLAAPRLAREAVRRLRWSRADDAAGCVEAAWSELRDTAIDLRVPWRDAVTLRTAARALVSSFGEPDLAKVDRLQGLATKGRDANPRATAALERLVKKLEEARYARSPDAPGGGVPGVDDVAESVRRDVALCVQALRDGVASPSRLWQARWLPRSLIGDWARRSPWRRRSDGDRLALREPGVDHAV